ncbi:MAG: hypothetical protein IPO93_17750 [Actinobacteria bacterium]|jgi:hypothetical protein|nr:hypothetical protein [Actinomycetota bacterium]
MKSARILMTVAGVGAASLALAPSAMAAKAPVDVIDISGTWKTASVVIDSGAPYYSMTLTPACKPATCYNGVIQFHFTDGTVGPKIKIGVAHDSNPTSFGVVFPGGNFIDNKNVIRGHVNNDGSLTLSRCWLYMTEASRATADTLCDFPAIAN